MLEWLCIEVGVDENALVVTEEKPGFIKLAIAVVNAWVAPLALSEDQMADVKAARHTSRATTSSVSTLGTGGGHGLHVGGAPMAGPGGVPLSPLHGSSFAGAVSGDDYAASHMAVSLPTFLSLDSHTAKGLVSPGASVGWGALAPSLLRQGSAPPAVSRAPVSIFDVGRAASSSGTAAASMPPSLR